MLALSARATPVQSSAHGRRGLTRACVGIAARSGLDTVVLSGGVFQNRVLLEAVATHVEGAGLRALVPQRLPPNDGGIAYGQAAVAARRME